MNEDRMWAAVAADAANAPDPVRSLVDHDRDEARDPRNASRYGVRRINGHAYHENDVPGEGEL